jgi:hypothetical protein
LLWLPGRLVVRHRWSLGCSILINRGSGRCSLGSRVGIASSGTVVTSIVSVATTIVSVIGAMAAVISATMVTSCMMVTAGAVSVLGNSKVLWVELAFLG